MSDTPAPRERVVEAAGAVVWRPAVHDRAEVLLIHRPRYDDWTFPKGKLQPGEHAIAAAVREVEEETGVRIRLGPPLPAARYRLRDGGQKVVRYWSAIPLGDSDAVDFQPSREVDRRGWFSLRQAARQLTHAQDRALLSRLRPVPTRPFVVLRHARAVARDSWQGADTERPLSEVGVAQAERLTALLAAYDPTHLVASETRRAIDTLLPYARSRGLEIEPDPAFGPNVDSGHVREEITRLLNSVESTVVCTHRETVPAVFEALGMDAVPLDYAEMAVVHLEVRSPVALERARVF
jgi:8-oxo-dGTP diphosphatase